MECRNSLLLEYIIVFVCCVVLSFLIGYQLSIDIEWILYALSRAKLGGDCAAGSLSSCSSARAGGRRQHNHHQSISNNANYPYYYSSTTSTNNNNSSLTPASTTSLPSPSSHTHTHTSSSITSYSSASSSPKHKQLTMTSNELGWHARGGKLAVMWRLHMLLAVFSMSLACGFALLVQVYARGRGLLLFFFMLYSVFLACVILPVFHTSIALFSAMALITRQTPVSSRTKRVIRRFCFYPLLCLPFLIDIIRVITDRDTLRGITKVLISAILVALCICLWTFPYFIRRACLPNRKATRAHARRASRHAAMWAPSSSCPHNTQPFKPATALIQLQCPSLSPSQSLTSLSSANYQSLPGQSPAALNSQSACSATEPNPKVNATVEHAPAPAQPLAAAAVIPAPCPPLITSSSPPPPPLSSSSPSSSSPSPASSPSQFHPTLATITPSSSPSSSSPENSPRKQVTINSINNMNNANKTTLTLANQSSKSQILYASTTSSQSRRAERGDERKRVRDRTNRRVQRVMRCAGFDFPRFTLVRWAFTYLTVIGAPYAMFEAARDYVYSPNDKVGPLLDGCYDVLTILLVVYSSACLVVLWQPSSVNYSSELSVGGKNRSSIQGSSISEDRVESANGKPQQQHRPPHMPNVSSYSNVSMLSISVQSECDSTPTNAMHHHAPQPSQHVMPQVNIDVDGKSTSVAGFGAFLQNLYQSPCQSPRASRKSSEEEKEGGRGRRKREKGEKAGGERGEKIVEMTDLRAPLAPRAADENGGVSRSQSVSSRTV